MKNMKKWLSLSLAGAMLMGVLAGCGGGTTSTPAPAETGAAEATGEPAAVEQVLKYGTDTWPAGFDPNRAVSFFFSTTGGANVWGYSNAQVDELCTQGVATTDEAEREAAYIEAQKIVIDESPNLFFASPMEYFFVGAGVEGFEPFAANANNFRTTYIAQ